jgi:membrane-associated protease RseP (regulator of RpoE activity)
MTILALISLSEQFLVIVILFYLSIIIHELGHLFAALIVGWKPMVMTIGTGKKKPLFRIRDLTFVLGARPSGGLMQSVARHISYWRPKRFLYVLG